MKYDRENGSNNNSFIRENGRENEKGNHVEQKDAQNDFLIRKIIFSSQNVGELPLIFQQ